MTIPFQTMTLRVLSTVVCTSLAACGGGGNADSASVPLSVSNSTTAVTAAQVTALAGATSANTLPATAAAKSIVADATMTVPDTSAARVSSALSATALSPSANTSAVAYGTYLRPFAVNSLWNSRPVQPVFGTFTIPRSSYFPTIASGAYSTGAFLAAATDKPMLVVGTGSTGTTVTGVADPDSGGSHVVSIPRWPSGVLPATGTDGHADIVDPVTNIIHSFWQLRQVNGQWQAALYSWSKLGGTGWGDPAHYYQGARAVGIPAAAGLIRKHEIKDGLATYNHALAMSLTFNGLANGASSPAYVFPATSADNSASANSGSIPQGALLMLPPGFDSSAIVNPDLKKVVETLKLYGAYVVDRNDGTPFVIYVENDSDFNLMPNGWDNTIASQLDLIRASLRQVVNAKGYVDGNGNSALDAIKAQQNMSFLSMRGPWYRQSGTAAATFDTTTQSLLFDATTTKTVQVNANNTGLTPAKWAQPSPGSYVKFSVTATGGATLRLQVKSGNVITSESTDLATGQSLRFAWPANASVILIATSGTNGASSVKAELVPAP